MKVWLCGRNFPEAQFTNLISRKRERLLFGKETVKIFQIYRFRFINSDRNRFSWDQIGRTITWIRHKVKSGDMSVRKWDWWIELRESGPKIDPAAGVRNWIYVTADVRFGPRNMTWKILSPIQWNQQSHMFKFLYITQLSYKRMFHNYRASSRLDQNESKLSKYKNQYTAECR